MSTADPSPPTPPTLYAVVFRWSSNPSRLELRQHTDPAAATEFMHALRAAGVEATLVLFDGRT
jgi:hypothetical protein